MAVSVYQEVELSLTENLVPPVIQVKQFDDRARKVRCILYAHAKEFTIPSDVMISVTGTRPDGMLFQYSSETAPEEVFVEDGKVLFTITEYMTRLPGRFLVDVVICDADGELIGTFSPMLKVEKAAVTNRMMIAATVDNLLDAIRKGIFDCTIDGYGRLVVHSDNPIHLKEGDCSSTMDAILNRLNEAAITDDGHLLLKLEERLELELFMDDTGVLTAIPAEWFVSGYPV